MMLLRHTTLLSLRPATLLTARSFHSARLLLQKDPFRDLEKSPQRPPEDPLVSKAPLVKPVANPKLNRIIERLPKWSQKYGKRLVNAPMAHITSFMILHEFTAIAPLFGLWWVFHNYGFLPTDIPSWMLLKGSAVVEKILGDTVADLSIQERTRLIIEGATAYGIVKATFPVRVVWSIFMTPWFSRVFVEPGMNGLGKLWVMMRGKK